LESAAAPDTVLISHHTYQHVRGVFDMQLLPAIEARGFPEPVPVYRVLRAKSRSFRTRRRGVEGVETRMIGRDAEMAALQELFHETTAGQFRAAIVVGEAGLGKSRLLYEFENWGDLQPVNVQLYRGRARQETQHLPFGLLRDVFVFRCGIFDDDQPPTVREKLVAGFRGVLGDDTAEMAAHLVGHLVGYDFSASPHVRPLLGDARQLRDQALQHLTAYFRAATLRRPLLLLLEDLHWADDSSLEVIDSLAAALRDRPAFILGAARPSFYERRPDWMAGRPGFRRIDLALLGEDMSGRLVTEILQKVENIPDRLRDLIVARAEGNPFYVEELIKMLIEQRVIVRRVIVRDEPGGSEDGERWQVYMDRLDDIHVPATLTGVLQARLDSLPLSERETLQRASVVGRLFWDAAVAYVAEAEPASVEPLWSALGRRELVYPREETAFEGTHEYVFKHALLRDVTYESVLRRLRRAYHQRAAEWLIQAGGDRVDEFADLIAAHYASAGDEPAEARWQARAGQHAAARFALPEAERALSRALLLLPPTAVAERYELLLQREAIYHMQGRRDVQDADLTSLAALATELGDGDHLAEAALRRGFYSNATGDLAAAIAAAAAAEHQARDDDFPRRARAHLIIGHAHRAQGEYEPARRHLETALSLARRGSVRDIESEALRSLGITAQEQGDLVSLRGYFEQALTLAREAGDRRSLRRTLNSLGILEENEANYDRARAYFQQSLEIARAIGDRTGASTVIGNLGVTEMDTGNVAAARACFEEALAITRETGDSIGINVWLLNLAFVVATEGDTEAALTLYEEARQGVEAAGDRPTLGYVLNGMGRVLLEAGRAAEAVAPLRAALKLREEMAQAHLLPESQIYLAEALTHIGELTESLTYLEAALPRLLAEGLETHEDTQRGLWAAYQVLTAAGDARASAVLARLQSEIEAVAAHLPADARRRYRDMHAWRRESLRLAAGRGTTTA
jgi:predicted ATPase